MTSPTQRSLKKLREAGYLCSIVERWNAYAKVRQDLFGFVDIVALGKNKTIGVQTTSYQNISARIKKIQESSNYSLVRDAGWIVVVHGWRKRKNRWECREVQL